MGPSIRSNVVLGPTPMDKTFYKLSDGTPGKDSIGKTKPMSGACVDSGKDK